MIITKKTDRVYSISNKTKTINKNNQQKRTVPQHSVKRSYSPFLGSGLEAWDIDTP